MGYHGKVWEKILPKQVSLHLHRPGVDVVTWPDFGEHTYYLKHKIEIEIHN